MYPLSPLPGYRVWVYPHRIVIIMTARKFILGLRDDDYKYATKENPDCPEWNNLPSYLNIHDKSLEWDPNHAIYGFTFTTEVWAQLKKIFRFEDERYAPVRAKHGLGWKLTIYTYEDDIERVDGYDVIKTLRVSNWQ